MHVLLDARCFGARCVRLIEVSPSRVAAGRGGCVCRPSLLRAPLLVLLAVVETEHIVVHIKVLRVGRSRHEQEHLAELERVGLALHLNAKEKRAAAAASRCQLFRLL